MQKYKALIEIEGEQLSSVEFVQDYLQLRFDGPTLNITNPIIVSTSEQKVRTGEDQFRNKLCKQIAKIVEKVSITEGKSLDIFFDDQSKISVLIASEDYDSPEGVYFHNFSNNQWGVI